MDDYTGKSSEKPGGTHKNTVPKELIEVLTAATVGELEEEALEKSNMPKWDGSEAKFIPDEDANEYEEQYSGIKLEYQLTKAELKSCIKKIIDNKKSSVANTVNTVLLAIVSAICLAEYVFYNNLFHLILLAISIFTIALIWFVPKALLKKQCLNRLHGKNCFVEVFPDEIVVVKQNNDKWTIPMDQSSEYEEFDDIILIYTRENKMLAIPLRSIEPSVIGDIQAVIVAGSRPK